MLSYRGVFILSRLRGCSSFSTSKSSGINFKRNESRELLEEPNHESSLLNLPDYTFLDGRPTPYGSGQRRRIEKQKKYTAKILELTSEVDLAMQLFKKREAAKQAADDKRIKEKLIEKGNKTLFD